MSGQVVIQLVFLSTSAFKSNMLNLYVVHGKIDRMNIVEYILTKF